MFRYYMTPETREAVIAESNRLIAARAALTASRGRPAPHRNGESPDSEWPTIDGATETGASALESTFSRLVSDLQSATAGRTRS